jgi:hypothetical protein
MSIDTLRAAPRFGGGNISPAFVLRLFSVSEVRLPFASLGW